eukprot:CAMPEP_0184697342 /NCGR_PEP_ID=MMETSP0313-20130426/4333_1 /TAXON_ID=2792 /ORGANISM="Porphyridium aerugineum, Strain SAG 1380-2" /LENGTH=164 /DNA_ID=CAMNT_0027156121 /DNA_START=76 /DNA_END=570 /DNA_ORIENTATION=+
MGRHTIDFTNSPVFVQACKLSFKKCDKNKDGNISTDELTLALTLFYFKVAQKMGEINDPPTRSEVDAYFTKWDKDKSGELSYDEYEEFVRSWVKDHGAGFAMALATGVVVQALVVPMFAEYLFKSAQKVKLLDKIPQKVIMLGTVLVTKVLFGLFNKSSDKEEA